MESKVEGRLYLTEREKSILTELIRENSSVIESKESGPTAIAKKAKGWQDLTQQFNATCSNKRSVSQLKKCWANIKGRAKKNLAEERRQKMKTGGGPPPPPVKDVEVEMVLQIESAGIIPPSDYGDEDSDAMMWVSLPSTSTTAIPHLSESVTNGSEIASPMPQTTSEATPYTDESNVITSLDPPSSVTSVQNTESMPRMNSLPKKHGAKRARVPDVYSTIIQIEEEKKEIQKKTMEDDNKRKQEQYEIRKAHEELAFQNEEKRKDELFYLEKQSKEKDLKIKELQISLLEKQNEYWGKVLKGNIPGPSAL